MWYWIHQSNRVHTVSLRLICCITNNLRDTIPVVLSEFFGFLKDNLKGRCRYSIRFYTRDCVPCSTIYRGPIKHEKSPLRIG